MLKWRHSFTAKLFIEKKNQNHKLVHVDSRRIVKPEVKLIF